MYENESESKIESKELDVPVCLVNHVLVDLSCGWHLMEFVSPLLNKWMCGCFNKYVAFCTF